MKILHINTERTWRGGEQQTLYLLRSLIERGIGCHLVSQAESPMAQKALEAGVEVFPSPCTVKRICRPVCESET